MTCGLCNRAIRKGSRVDYHHPVYQSEGGTETVAVHQTCHVEYHSRNGDFRRWGRLGGLQAAATLRWAFHLKNVRTHPAYAPHRQFYLMNYAYAGWSAGLI